MSLDPGETAACFRAEVRDWLAAHMPAEPLPSVDTAAGFARHRDWERELAAARLAVVSWPPEYGGRGASRLHWLIFEEEYYGRGAGAGRPERPVPAGPDAVRARHGRAAGRSAAPDGQGGRHLGASLVGAGCGQ